MPATLAAPAPATDPRPTDLTADDFYEMGDEASGCELIDGELVGQPVSYLSSFVAGKTYRLIANYALDTGSGWPSPEGTGYRCFPGDDRKVRKADTAFHRLDRLTAEVAGRRGFCPVVPDLVVEVVSPADLAEDVDDKRRDWLAAGAQLVWVVYPSTRSVHAFAADGTVRLFGPADALTAEPVLPGFSCPVADLFALPATASAAPSPPA
jgi:Uma2 family endonuclease